MNWLRWGYCKSTGVHMKKIAIHAAIAVSFFAFVPLAAKAGACDPVEVVPGVKQTPRGCSASEQKAARLRAEPPAKDKKDYKIGDTDVRFNGSVWSQYTVGTKR